MGCAKLVACYTILGYRFTIIRDIKGQECTSSRRPWGGLSLYWALKDANVTYSDISDKNFENAKYLHQKYGMYDIDYRVVDATTMDYDSEYDIVSFKSVLGAIGNINGTDKRRLAINNICRALKPDGKLYFVENLMASNFHQWLRHKYINWGNRWKYLDLQELSDFSAGFKDVQYETFGYWGVIGSHIQLTGLAGAVDKVFDRFVKENHRYIVSCVMCK